MEQVRELEDLALEGLRKVTNATIDPATPVATVEESPEGIRHCGAFYVREDFLAPRIEAITRQITAWMNVTYAEADLRKSKVERLLTRQADIDDAEFGREALRAMRSECAIIKHLADEHPKLLNALHSREAVDHAPYRSKELELNARIKQLEAVNSKLCQRNHELELEIHRLNKDKDEGRD